MTRSTSPLIALMVLAALLAAPADAAQRTRKRPEPPPPPQFKVDVATRPMAMDRLALSIPAGSVIGKLKTGCFLSGSSEPLYTEHAFRGVPTQDYIGVFSAEAGAAGYRVASAQAGDLFTSGEAAKAELVVGAAILSLKADGCIDPGIMGFSTSMDSTVAVDWQVFDPLEKKIVFRGSNQGVAKVKVNQASSLISIEAARGVSRGREGHPRRSQFCRGGKGPARRTGQRVQRRAVSRGGGAVAGRGRSRRYNARRRADANRLPAPARQALPRAGR